MPRTHPSYPAEFRAEAVRLARGSDKSIPRWRQTSGSRPRRRATGCGRRMPTKAEANPAI